MLIAEDVGRQYIRDDANAYLVFCHSLDAEWKPAICRWFEASRGHNIAGRRLSFIGQ